jgi:hypothetical protein
VLFELFFELHQCHIFMCARCLWIEMVDANAENFCRWSRSRAERDVFWTFWWRLC